jgi:hypothetical protein
MPSCAARPALLLSMAAAAISSAQAQTAPPIKPGLWEIRSEREVDGKKAPDPTEQMKNLPPEVRAKVEAMMKEKGVGLGDGGMNRVCLSRESLDQGRWQGQSDNCKTEFTDRSTSSWKWHSVCTKPDSESDGEAAFANSENYTVKTLMKTKAQGQERVTRMTITAKWAGNNCGDIKPVQPKP